MTSADMDRIVSAVLLTERDGECETAYLLAEIAKRFPEHELEIRAAYMREHPKSEGLLP